MLSKTCAACVAALAGAALLPAAPAFAGEEPMVATARPREAQSIAVSYRDLNLVNAAGVDTLNARARRAARAICDVGEIQPLKQVQDARECYSGAMERAGRDIEIAVAAARNGEQLASRDTARTIGVSR